MNKEIIPQISSVETRKKYLQDIDAWKNFAQRITHNPFVKEYLFKRDGNKCSWCNWFLTKDCNIHHLTYDHFCDYSVTKEISTPTEKRPNRKRVVPDCESCMGESETRFLNCMNKLSLVHGLCNKKIELARERTLNAL